ncbi:hypothetical protein HK096_005399, partial [Nowakowskiella sp. JEL0078]
MSSVFVTSTVAPPSDLKKGWACEATNSCDNGIGPTLIVTIAIMSVIGFMAIFGMILWVRMRMKRDNDVCQAQKQRRDRYLHKRRRRGSKMESGIVSSSTVPIESGTKISSDPILMAGSIVIPELERASTQQQYLPNQGIQQTPDNQRRTEHSPVGQIYPSQTQQFQQMPQNFGNMAPFTSPQQYLSQYQHSPQLNYQQIPKS